MKMRKTYTKEFKETACKRVMQNGEKYDDVAIDIGVHKIMLYRWVREYFTQGEKAFVGKGRARNRDAEIKKLYHENQRLRRENELLKKSKNKTHV